MENARPDRPRPRVPEPEDRDTVLELIEQIKARIRVEEGFEKLSRRFRPSVQSFFLRKGFSAEDSRDLTIEVFLRVRRDLGAFRLESRFERWLWEIAAHIYFNEVRRRRTEKRDRLEQSLDTPMANDEGANPSLGLPGPNPEELVIGREQATAFRAALQELPAQMRRCCILRYEKGLKYQEIAELMGISIETVKAQLHQARKRLAAGLAGESEDSESEKGILEADLIERIHRFPSKDFISRYEQLAAMRDAEQLSEAEARELLGLSDHLERMTVERLEALAELARIRGIPLRVLAQEMGIKPIVNA